MKSNIASWMTQVPFFFYLTFTIFNVNVLAVYLFLRISCKLWKTEQRLLLLTDRKSCICCRMVPLRMLCVMTLNYIFKVTDFEMWISRKRRKIAWKWSSMTFIDIDIWHRTLLCLITLRMWPWPRSSKSNFPSDYFDK